MEYVGAALGAAATKGARFASSPEDLSYMREEGSQVTLRWEFVTIDKGNSHRGGGRVRHCLAFDRRNDGRTTESKFPPFLRIPTPRRSFYAAPVVGRKGGQFHSLQRSVKVGAPGLVNFIPAVA